ncbi:MAG: DNA primase [Acidimicrobiales bacterium]
MGIPDEEVARVRTATDFVSLASEHIALKRQGRRWIGLCPFHAEKSPSFSLNAEEGLYYCFGCQASGDVISFVRALEGLDFPDAVERLAARAGLTLQVESDEVGTRQRSRRRELTQAMETAVAWYHERLLRSPDAGPARDYLRSRGYDGDVVRNFKLGWAPEDWDSLSVGIGLSREVLVGAGLAFVNRRNRLQDSFRGRVLIPIFDSSGRAVGLGGRILPGRPGAPGADDRGEPKYKNSAETPIYSKRRVLYGLNWAKADVVHGGEIIVCEGYTDVIGFFGAGLPRAVATCGTALAEEHFKLMSNFARRVVLAYDADGAGQAAADRFYEWEKRHDLDIVVAAIPTGSDPADLARSDPEALRRAVNEAKPFMAFRLDRVLSRADLATVEGRARAAEEGVAVIAEHPSAFVRDQYLMEVADRCRIAPERLRPFLSRAGKIGAGSSSGAAPSAPVPAAPTRRLEYDALLLAVHRPEDMVDRLEDVLFSDDANREVLRCLTDSATMAEAVEAAGPRAASLLARLAVDEAMADPDEVFASLVRDAAERALTGMQARARSAPDDGDELVRTMAWLRLEVEPLRRNEVGEPAAINAAARLLAWLSVEGKEYV